MPVYCFLKKSIDFISWSKKLSRYIKFKVLYRNLGSIIEIFSRLNLDFELLLWNFSGLTNTMIHIWLPMQLCGLFVVYFMLKVWSQARQRINRLVADILYTTLFSAYMGLFMWLPVRLVADISLSCRIIILTEQVRILMKTYAFVRSNVPRVLANTQPVPEKGKHLFLTYQNY